MSLTQESAFDYSSSYFQSGMSGWHALSFPLITEDFKKFAQGRRFATGLDFGCGDGFYGHFLGQFVNELSGADVSPCIEDAANRCAYKTFSQADLGRPIASCENTYEVIFSSEVIEHVRDYETFLANAYHLLVPGGSLFLTTTTFGWSLPVYLMQHPKRWSLRAIIQYFCGLFGSEQARISFLRNLWEWTKGHHHGFSKRQLSKALRKTGFEIQSLKYFHAQPLIYTDFFRNPFKRTKCRWIILPVARMVGSLASSANFLCKRLDLYAPNVVVVARKPPLGQQLPSPSID
jgi:2-polyprenyl-3-methyl-5-hydroxy-6-metoxy-1,4-benzoquinol methylase